MKKKNVLVNILLIMVLIALILGAIFLRMKIKTEEERIEKENVVLKDIVYDSDVMQVGYRNSNALISNFINAYNSKNGEQLVQSMNLVATYIYSECEHDGEFDRKYEEKLSTNLPAEELLIIQYSLQKEEKGIIEGVTNSDVELTLMECSEIQDVSKYLSKMTAKIRTISASDNVDEVDTLEFLLLHRDDSYQIIKYDMTETVPYNM